MARSFATLRRALETRPARSARLKNVSLKRSSGVTGAAGAAIGASASARLVENCDSLCVHSRSLFAQGIVGPWAHHRKMNETESGRLAALGYRQELSRVLSLFDNFAVAFSYLSPMVGVYSLYTLGLGTGGPRYIWTIPVVVGLMMLVALVFGELASEYPLSGALYQYGKYSVGPRYGWFIGWIYGFALLATVASVDSGAVGYVTSLSNIWFQDASGSGEPPDDLRRHRRDYRPLRDRELGRCEDHGRVARFGVYVETIGTFGVFLALAALVSIKALGSSFRRRTSSISRTTRSA